MSLDYIEDKDIAGNAASSIIGQTKNAIVATGADLLATIWNSTAGNLGADDMNTRDIISKVDKDALSLYDAHKEGVEAASFLAGIIAPQALTLKLLGAVKNGASVLGKTNSLTSKAADVFSGSKSHALQTELRVMLENAGADTVAYSRTMNKLYATRIGENAIDAAIFEMTTVATLNAHPYMEDYMQSPMTNFALWAGIGAGIGAPLAYIGTKMSLKQTLGPIAKAAQDDINAMIMPVNQAMPNAAKIQTLNITIANGEALLAEGRNVLGTGVINDVLLVTRGEKVKRMEAAAPWLQSTKDKNGKIIESEFIELKPAVEALLSTPEMMGVHSIKIPKMTFVPKKLGERLTLEVEMLEKPTKEVLATIKEYEKDITYVKQLTGTLENRATLTRLEQELKELKETGSKLKTVFYRPSTGDLYDRNLAGASALAVDIKGYSPNAKNINLNSPRGDWFLENAGRGMPSAKADADYLDALLAWNKVNAKDVQYYGIAPTDLASQRGAISWMSGKSAEFRETIEFNLRSDQPSFQQTQKFIESGAAGVKATYFADAKVIIDKASLQIIDNLKIFQGVGAKDSQMGKAVIAAFDMLNDWQAHSNNARLRNAMSAFLQHSTGSGNPVDKLAAELIFNSGTRLREELKKVAAADGTVRLYRGIHGKATSHAPVEGYTLSESVARKFGSARLVSVPIDNVIGRIGGNEFIGEGEILVSAGYHKILNGLDIETGANKAVHIQGSGSIDKVNGVQLVQHHTAETERQILELIKDKSFAPEEIAARLNTTKEAVLLVGAGRNLDEIPNWARYTDAAKIESEYLNPKNRILALQGNPNTIRASQMSGNLDQRFLNVSNTQFIEQTIAGSKNPIANEFMQLYNPIDDLAAAKTMKWNVDQLSASLGDVNNILVDSPFFASLDHALRAIQAGPFVTYLGKEASKLGDRITKRLMTPMAVGFKGLGSNNAALTELLVADNKLLSLAGWKGIRVDEENGFRYIVQREIRDVPDAVTGKMVKQEIEVPVKKADGSVYYIKTAEAANAIEGTFETAKELLGAHNVLRKLQGLPPLNDLGTYLPPPNLTNKFYSYVFDNTGKARPQVLYADTAKELAGLELAYQTSVIKGNPTLEIINSGKQRDLFNHIHGYMDGDPFMTSANINLKHAGASASAIIASDARRVDEIMSGFNHQILTVVRKLNEMYLGDTMQKLDIFSQLNQKRFEGAALRGLNKEKGKDAAMTVKNGLLGISNLDQFTTWKTVNQFVDMAIVKTSRAIDATLGAFKDDIGSTAHWEALNRDLKTAGIDTPFESFQLYQASLIGGATVNSKRLVAAQNGLLGTMILRVADLAQPLVNAISLPILTNAAIMGGLPKTFLENGVGITLPGRLPMDAMRFNFLPQGREFYKRMLDGGHVSLITREFADLAGELQTHVKTKGDVNAMLDKLEQFQKSKFVEFFSTGSDLAEKMTRVQALNVGYLGAKHAYPGISDRGADIFAVAMSDRIIGNYYSAQRPVMFQGTAGMGIGLFQTYMLSFAQATYRHIEEKQFKALASTMLMQAGIFGMASWPGYETLSKFIGEHMSNQNYDLTTGTYRAVGKPMAEVILYGLPSTLGPNLYTRGDIAPRIPAAMADLAIVNSTVGVYNAASKMLSSVVTQPGFAGKLQGMMEGLSLQTLSRPIARASEIVAGESITRKGQTVATSDDVWTMNGIFSRMLSVRPLEEQVVRNALNLKSYYGAADHDNRQAAVGKLRTAIRAGNMSDDLVETVAQDYIRHGGHNVGWTAVMNEIMSRTEEGTSYDLLRKLEPDSPLRRMLKDTF